MSESPEVQESHLELVERLSAELPRFEDGRVDYTKSPVAPVVNCIVWYDDKILLLQRSDRVANIREVGAESTDI